tara:strand:+ start:171 stop:1187 length:1017 start_codon:yes stop_codon:yes gene_type:complete
MLRKYRVIDANLNRAKEGLRVIEDICRFILEDGILMEKIKEIRHNLNALVSVSNSTLINSRGDGINDFDIARNREVKSRNSTKKIFVANIKRVTEALRVLEEFTENFIASNKIKDLRYLVYDLEKRINQKLFLKLPFENDLYVISDSVEVLKKAVNQGASIVQLRDKSGNKESIKQRALEMINFKFETRNRFNRDFIFIINDYPNLAKEIGADGVHLGQEDMGINEARRILGENFIIGKSTHSIQQGLAAQQEGVNYISVGPVYSTPTKEGKPSVGVNYVQEAARNIKIPFVAIGGINLETVDVVLSFGANTVAVVRAHYQASEILRKIKKNNDENNN